MNQNPLDWNYAFNSPDGNSLFGPFSIAFFAVFTIGFLISNFFYFYGKYRFKTNRLTYTIVNRASRNAAIAFTLGFVFFLCRLSQLPPFSARIFLDIALLMLIYYVVRGVLYMLRTYPKAKAEWETLQQRSRRRTEVETPEPIKVAPVKGTVATTGAIASGSADAGSEETVIRPATPRGLSPRGQKRRERKRNSR